MYKLCLKVTSASLLAITICTTLSLWFLSQVKTEGTLYLEHARGKVTITREKDTNIPHIRGETWENAIYGQGFVHAQTRLWNLEKVRRVSAGRISELFGEEVLSIDKFMRTIRIRAASLESYDIMDEESKKTLQAYADGINDYVAGISMTAG